MQMSLYHLQFCTALTDEMAKRPVCEPFLKRGDLFNWRLGDYAKRPRNSLCIERIKHKLETNAYSNVSSWVSDVESIWLTVLASNPEDSLLSCIALDVLQWFRKKLGQVSWHLSETNIVALMRAAKEMSAIVRQPPSDRP
jgi:hypothetical protein